MNETSLNNTPSANIVSQATATESSAGLFNLNIDIGSIVSTLNYFALAWCIIYTFMLVSDFFFWRVLYTNLEIPRLKRGEKSLIDASKIWWGYFLVAFAFLIYTLLYDTGIADVFGMFLITGYIVKLLFDLPLIPVLGELPNKIIEGFKKSAKVVTPELPKKEEKK